MVLAIALTALLFAAPAFFLSLYIAVKLAVTKEEKRVELSRAMQENSARALSDLHLREMDAVTPEALSYDFGINEENL